MSSESMAIGRTHVEERGLTLSVGAYWHRIALFLILLLAAALNVIGLSKEGYGNTYYAAAVRSMMENWHAFFFNSLDPAGFVTIDKPPLGFWLQVLSAKIFGFNGVALMLPQAIAGVLSVAVLYRLVSRPFGKGAGLIAALALALTPISVVANRNNIVDGTLVLAVLLGAWALMRAVETGKLWPLLLCALCVGLGFNVKMLEAYLVVPAFGLMYLVGVQVSWRRRILNLLAAAVILIGISLSWVLAVDLTPASQRPWVGSTTTNSELDLAIGYNGLQRLTGNSSVGSSRAFGGGGGLRAGGGTGSTGPGTGTGAAAPPGTGRSFGGPGGPGGNGGPGGVGENGPVGPLRLLDTQLGSQVSWLLILGIIGFFAGAWVVRRRWPLDAQGSGLVLWGTWLLTAGIFFSIAGFYHTYYLVMVAPAVAALSGIGIAALWTMYRRPGGRLWFLLPLGLLATAAVQAHILNDYPAWSGWMTPLVVGLTVLAALALAVLRLLPRMGVQVMLPALLVAVGALLIGPAVWSVQSVEAANTGTTPRAGPAGANSGFGPGSGRQSGGFGRRTGEAGNFFGSPGSNGQPPGGGIQPPSGNGQPPEGGFPGGRSGGFFGPPGGSFGRGFGGGPGNDSVNKRLLTYLEAHQGKATYLFATQNAGTAESYIIATGKAVMAMGGFTGSDPILNSSKVAALVKADTVRYFLLGGSGGLGGDRSSSVSSWVQNNCALVPSSKYSSATTSAAGFGGVGALYDCRGAA